MIAISYAPSFLRQLKTMPVDLQDAVCDIVEEFKYQKNHKTVKVHTLHGRLQDRWSFSVDYRTRIVFIYGEIKEEVVFLAIGSHDVYK